MESVRRSLVFAVALFIASLLGMALQWALPAQFLTEAKGTIGGMVGLVTLLLALVLGLLVFTAFAVFTTQQSEAYSLGPVVIEIDFLLAQFGPGAQVAREGLRRALKLSRARFFGDVKNGPQSYTFEETRDTMHALKSDFDRLRPATEEQRSLVASARDLAKKFIDTEMLMSRQLDNPFPPYVLTVVACWASALFLGNGLLAIANPVSVGVHLAGALAIGSAIFLILELSTPYSGFIRLSAAGLDRLILVLGEVKTEASV